eukprot:CAMPEP_0206482116 /NCGR_PEP_ID=MMETSP0324_2-20121206/38662_1 /ASSEMBLY_ACC=CAM_ASM_000836 /TAXON_ID=2866 /ORGANISM="Crypthecodinium cohnii, Strain Seligo" /LENGTH=290 /DNA_ID=CAMNT_0053959961 /DNA_START=667 /DNA_END=1539 /DNA_ORIENTATION=+
MILRTLGECAGQEHRLRFCCVSKDEEEGEEGNWGLGSKEKGRRECLDQREESKRGPGAGGIALEASRPRHRAEVDRDIADLEKSWPEIPGSQRSKMGYFRSWPRREDLQIHQLSCNSESTRRRATTLAGLTQSTGDYVKAGRLHGEILAIRREVLGTSHPDTLTSLSAYATCLHLQGKALLAEPLYREALNARRARLGQLHPDTLCSCNKLATLLHGLGFFQEAEELYREALAGRSHSLGLRHPDTDRTRKNLEVLLASVGSCSKDIVIGSQTSVDCNDNAHLPMYSSVV